MSPPQTPHRVFFLTTLIAAIVASSAAALSLTVGLPVWAMFVGWIAFCVAAGLAVGALFGRWRFGGVRRYASLFVALLFVGAFTCAPYWLGLDAPMSAKIAFTTSLQIVGSAVPIALILWLCWSAQSSARRT